MFELAKVNDVFADFQEQIKEAKKVNEQTVFDYEDMGLDKLVLWDFINWVFAFFDFKISLASPSSAAGNEYEILWC